MFVWGRLMQSGCVSLRSVVAFSDIRVRVKTIFYILLYAQEDYIKYLRLAIEI